MEKQGWKITAIVFISLFVVETLIMGYLIQTGLESIENENICAFDICEDSDSYYYDIYEEVCYCYDYNMLGELEVVDTELM